jgi:indolepyruvate ferredoxin oxidoreductase
MRALRAAAPVRGTLLDPFRWAKVRRVERAMIPEYVDAVERLIARLDAGNVEEATRIASLPDQVRGFEDLKLRRSAVYRDELASGLAAFAGALPER